MDATTRWETEALRDGDRTRPSPPKPTKVSRGSRTHWVTLKEAEAATGIPVNTLRKWVRRSALPSYLESDGDIALRMVDLDAVRRRARELGRKTEQQTTDGGRQTTDDRHQTPDGAQLPKADEASTVRPSGETGERSEPRGSQAAQISTPESHAWEPATDDRQQTTDTRQAPPTPGTEVPTMLVPVDAWNKMLSQLGNLHEAGQQLAEARERAAKSETEATFLRERLSELRKAPAVPPEGSSTESDPSATAANKPDPIEVAAIPEAEPRTTTTYWRYVTTGWRDRRRRGTD